MVLFDVTFPCFLFVVISWQMTQYVDSLMAEQSPQSQANTSQLKKVSDVTPEEDPFVWLEDVTGENALNWVRQRNEKTQKKFENDPFRHLENDLLTILDSDERIPFVSKQGDFYYNFWRDKKNERGLWRRNSG